MTDERDRNDCRETNDDDLVFGPDDAGIWRRAGGANRGRDGEVARVGDGGERRWEKTGGNRCRNGRTVDALAPAAEEGRSHAAKRSGEGLAPGDPEISEWGNPATVMGRRKLTLSDSAREMLRGVWHQSTAGR